MLTIQLLGIPHDDMEVSKYCRPCAHSFASSKISRKLASSFGRLDGTADIQLHGDGAAGPVWPVELDFGVYKLMMLGLLGIEVYSWVHLRF